MIKILIIYLTKEDFWKYLTKRKTTLFQKKQLQRKEHIKEKETFNERMVDSKIANESTRKSQINFKTFNTNFLLLDQNEIAVQN